MEDFVRVEQPFAGGDDRMYAAVFDGHGGEAVSHRASRELHGIVAAELASGVPTGSALAAAFRTFDDRVAAESSGSTAAVVVLEGRAATVANAGDSHVALVSRGGVAVLTVDHRLTNEGEYRRVVAAGAEIDGAYAFLPGGPGLMCTRSLGDRQFRRIGIVAEPDVSARETGHEDEWIILGSDGVWDGTTAEDVAGIARRATTAQLAAEGIRDAALAASSDNVSVVAIRLP